MFAFLSTRVYFCPSTRYGTCSTRVPCTYDEYIHIHLYEYTYTCVSGKQHPERRRRRENAENGVFLMQRRFSSRSSHCTRVHTKRAKENFLIGTDVDGGVLYTPRSCCLRFKKANRRVINWKSPWRRRKRNATLADLWCLRETTKSRDRVNAGGWMDKNSILLFHLPSPFNRNRSSKFPVSKKHNDKHLL